MDEPPSLRDHAPVRRIASRLVAGLFAVTWLVLPGFGLADLAVSWDPDWPVVLEASWGVFMTVLVAGSFAAVAVRPSATAAAQVVLSVVAAAWLVSAVGAREWELLGFTAFLALQAGLLAALLPARERLRPLRWSVHMPLLAIALAAAAPWLLHAADMYRLNRANTYEWNGDITMGTDH